MCRQVGVSTEEGPSPNYISDFMLTSRWMPPLQQVAEAVFGRDNFFCSRRVNHPVADTLSQFPDIADKRECVPFYW